MTDKPLDLDAIEHDLQRQLDRTRRTPTEPLVSLTVDDLRGLIAAARERDALKAKLDRARVALKGVIAVADRKTTEFDYARAILAELDADQPKEE